MAISRKDFVPVEGDLSLDSGTSHVVPGSDRSLLELDKPQLGGRSVPPASLLVPSDDKGSHGSGLSSESSDDTSVVPSEDNSIINSIINPDIWSPDTSLSSDENLDSLYSWMYNFIQNAGLTDINMNNIAGNYLRIMSGIAASVKSLFDSIGYERKDNQGAIIDIIEKTTNIAQGYLDTLFTQVLSYQSWYLQQEYNSPANQLKRLEQAGLSSSFIFGNYSNSASNPASLGSAMAAGSTMSGAGSAAAAGRAASVQEEGLRWDAILRAGSNIGILLEQGVSSFKSLAEADNIKQMTPIQVASSLYQFQNLGVTYDYYRAQIAQIENDVASDWFKNEFSAYQQDVTSASERVQAAQKSLTDASSDTFALSMGSKFIDTESYSGLVKSKDKGFIRKDYTLDELSHAYENHGYDEDGNEVFSEEDLRSSGSMSGGLSIPALGFNVGASGSIEAGEKEGEKSSSKHGSSRTNTDSSSQSSGHWDDRTNTLTIGKQKFTRTTTKKLMNSKEYSDYMESCRRELVSAKDDYFYLTHGERARQFNNYQMYLDNKATGLKWMMSNRLRNSLYNYVSPKSIIGD